MEINTNIGPGGVYGAPAPKRAAAAANSASTETSFAGATALDSALRSVPDSRPEVVDRARTLINNPDYPPMEIIRKFSRLLAISIDAETP